MNKYKRTYGLLSVLAGYVLLILFIDSSSKPENIGIALRPIESLETYLFGFVWIMGSIGWLIGSVLLIGYLILFYFIGIRIYNIRHSKVK